MTNDREQGSTLDPKYDANGLVTAVATHAGTGELLMLAHMNAEALAKTIETRRGLVLVALARAVVEEGRELGACADRARDARRLRSGCDLADRGAGGSGLPYRRGELLLSAG